MGIEHYAFSLFIAGLISLIAILFKLLFGNVKRQQKLLDDKETSLMQLYQTVESIMDEFNDQIRIAMDDIKEYENRAAAAYTASFAKMAEPEAIEPVQRPPQTILVERPAPPRARSMTVDSSRIRVAGEVLERAERMVIGNVGGSVDYTVGEGDERGGFPAALFNEISDEQQSIANVVNVVEEKTNSRDLIISLAQEGKTQAQIAQELGITQNEVKLVINLSNALAT